MNQQTFKGLVGEGQEMAFVRRVMNAPPAPSPLPNNFHPATTPTTIPAGHAAGMGNIHAPSPYQPPAFGSRSAYAYSFDPYGAGNYAASSPSQNATFGDLSGYPASLGFYGTANIAGPSRRQPAVSVGAPMHTTQPLSNGLGNTHAPSQLPRTDGAATSPLQTPSVMRRYKGWESLPSSRNGADGGNEANAVATSARGVGNGQAASSQRSQRSTALVESWISTTAAANKSGSAAAPVDIPDSSPRPRLKGKSSAAGLSNTAGEDVPKVTPAIPLPRLPQQHTQPKPALAPQTAPRQPLPAPTPRQLPQSRQLNPLPPAEETISQDELRNLEGVNPMQVHIPLQSELDDIERHRAENHLRRHRSHIRRTRAVEDRWMQYINLPIRDADADAEVARIGSIPDAIARSNMDPSTYGGARHESLSDSDATLSTPEAELGDQPGGQARDEPEAEAESQWKDEWSDDWKSE